MSEQKQTDDARLNALADGELDSLESQALLDDIKHDPEMHRALCDIHLLKDMMQAAYPEQQKAASPNHGRRNILSAIAASIMILAVGFISGRLFSPESLSDPFQLAQVETQPNKVVIFLGFADDDKFVKAMNKAEALMQQYQQKDVRVDIVASGGGLDLLRSSTTPYAERIHLLASKYDSLDFVACSNTIANLKKQGKQVDIVKEAIVAPSAVQFVVQRLQQGWSYLEV